ncbi:helix-turn-helix domain-containing protein [Azospirillum thiophilum]|nr:helix-turn-helix domain-containing protein [Azospirillum thiophilum]
MPLDQPWYSLDEVADRYGVTRRTVERWAQDRRIVVTTLAGTTRRISAASLLAFELHNQSVTLPPALAPEAANPSGAVGGGTKRKHPRSRITSRRPG